MFSIPSPIRKVIATALLAIGAAASTSAVAAPTFQIDPNTNGFSTAGTIVTADGLNGNSSARIVQDLTYGGPGVRYTGVGYIAYTGLTLNGQPVDIIDSRLGLDYQLYATFNQSFTCGSLLNPGVTCSVDTVSLSLFGDTRPFSTFTQATVAADPSVNPVGTQVLLGTVDTVLAGEAGIDTLGGAFQNVNTNFNLTAAGELFFIDPIPFYTFAFSAFNNTSQGISCDTGNGLACVNATIVAITQETGVTDFNGLAIPEPGPLALIGLGLLGMGFLRRKSA